MRPSPGIPACLPRSSRGFALLITITLLAFLVLLLVSLASLTRVETQVASNNQQLAQARQNALMALNIALGELQKYTGPDQRTTARSDMDAALDNTTTASGRWLGAYGNGATADYAQSPSTLGATITGASDSRGSQAKLLNWLVSGNENTRFDPAADVSPAGQILSAPPAPAYLPTSPVVNLSASSSALDRNITVRGSEARLLVGPNTAGNSAADYVAAPLKSIAAVVPGAGDTPVTIGNYAWWVGDEGSKARLNLPLAGTHNPHDFNNTARAGVELVDALHPSAGTTLTAADMLNTPASTTPLPYNPGSPLIPGLLSTAQLSLLSASTPPATGAALRLASQYRYHDLTPYSSSVLSDTYAGGLKKDLSSLLATGAGAPLARDFLFTPEAGSERGVPTWGQLRDFVGTLAPSAGVLPRLPAWDASTGNALFTNVGISPVMTYAVLGFEVIANGPDAPGTPLQLAVLPVVVLWNPYTVPIRGRDDAGQPIRYEVGMRKQTEGILELQAANPDPGATGWTSAHVLSAFSLQTATSATDPHFRFTIESPAAGFQPGESLVFTLKNPSGETYTGSNVLVNGYNNLRYVLMPAGFTSNAVIAAPGATYRVASNSHTPPNSALGDAPKTKFLGSPTSMRGTNADSSHTGYFGAFPSLRPGADEMLVGPAPGLASRGMYQAFKGITGPSNQRSPYGSNTTVIGAGYAISNGATGLVQPAGPIHTAVANPPFRMLIINRFMKQPADTGRSPWMAQHNVRASAVGGAANFSGKATSNSWPPDLQSPDGLHVSSGTGPGDTSDPSVATTLFEFRAETLPLLSVGQLQHANLGSSGAFPGYAIGNSSSGIAQLDSSNTRIGIPDQVFVSGDYDDSFLLNRALWDKYFVSTVPNRGTGTAADNAVLPTTPVPAELPNRRHVRYNITPDEDPAATAAKLRNADTAAAHLLLSGGFNINSTSEQAWRAILGGSNQLNYDPSGVDPAGAWSKVVYSRFSKPTTNAILKITTHTTSPNTNASTGPYAAWVGYRQLNETQIARLAANIVAQIRKRGPSISYADFVNRRLTGPDAFYPPVLNDPRVKGTIQSAIDATTSGASAINDGTAPFVTGNRVSRFSSGANTNLTPFDTGGSPDMLNPVMPYGSMAAFGPQFLTQADVLSNIGSGLSARSDTFIIRTYGEAVNPALISTDAGYVTGRTWCEAVVQRLPDYVDDSMPAETHLQAAPASAAKTLNHHFGRKFKIISFRWLSSNDV